MTFTRMNPTDAEIVRNSIWLIILFFAFTGSVTGESSSMSHRVSRKLQGLESCINFQAQIDNASLGRVTFLEDAEFLCSGEEIHFRSSDFAVEGFEKSGKMTKLISNNSTIIISANNVTIKNLVLVGNWKIHIFANISVTFHKIILDQAVVLAEQHAQLHLSYLKVSRLSQCPAALRVNASLSSISITSTSFSDNFTGTMLDLAGDHNNITLHNLTFNTTDPNTTPDLTNVAVTGLAVLSHFSAVTVTASSFWWCGLHAIALTGSSDQLRVQASDFYQNTAVGLASGREQAAGGGALMVTGSAMSVLVEDSTMRGQWSDTRGGGVGIDCDDCSLTLRGCAVNANQVGEAGGAVSFQGLRGVLLVAGCVMADNIVFGSDAGALLFSSAGGRAVIVRSEFRDNVVYENGGALFQSGDAALIAQAVFQGNSASAGGGVYSLANETTIRDSSFVNNSAGGSCGGGAFAGFCGDGSCDAGGMGGDGGLMCT